MIAAGTNDPSLLEQLAPYLGVVGTLAGAWLASTWSRRNGYDAWQRDRRLDAYSRFLSALGDVQERAAQANFERSEDKMDHRVEAIVVSITTLRRLEPELYLLGPRTIEDPVAEAINVATQYLDAVVDVLDPSGTDPLPDNRQLIEATAQFAAAAQSALR